MVPVMSTIGAAPVNNEGSSDMMVVDENMNPPQNSFKYTINWAIID